MLSIECRSIATIVRQCPTVDYVAVDNVKSCRTCNKNIVRAFPVSWRHRNVNVRDCSCLDHARQIMNNIIHTSNEIIDKNRCQTCAHEDFVRKYCLQDVCILAVNNNRNNSNYCNMQTSEEQWIDNNRHLLMKRRKTMKTIYRVRCLSFSLYFTMNRSVSNDNWI
jgi:hypothetical protein